MKDTYNLYITNINPKQLRALQREITGCRRSLLCFGGALWCLSYALLQLTRGKS